MHSQILSGSSVADPRLAGLLKILIPLCWASFKGKEGRIDSAAVEHERLAAVRLTLVCTKAVQRAVERFLILGTGAQARPGWRVLRRLEGHRPRETWNVSVKLFGKLIDESAHADVHHDA
jgi:hypothetical protein